MKKILFAMAALAALASCQKAEIAEQNSVNTNGERVITAYFDNAQTKTTLDGVTPKWTEGDKIMLLDGSSKQEITLDADDISSDGKSVTIATTLEGTLYAVYPSDATDADRIVTENIVPVTLKAEQDGTFGSANICVAKENDGSLAFKNVTSVLHLTQTAATTKVNEIILTTGSATAYIAGTGTVDMSTDGQPALALSSNQSNKIKVKSESAESDYYIAVVPTTLPAGTAFGFATGSALGGTNLSEEKTIAANTIYNVGSMDANAISPHTYHDYVEIEMTVNSETKKYKWATMNIGATSPAENGYYFFWGGTEGYIHDGSKWVKASDNTTELPGGFISENKPDIGSPATLPLENDAANANWGGSWRKPTKEEFEALAALGSTWGDTPAGRTFGTYPNQIFLPAAGSGYASDFGGVGEGGAYWSSSLDANLVIDLEEGEEDYTVILALIDEGAGTGGYFRFKAGSVRALSE